MPPCTISASPPVPFSAFTAVTIDSNYYSAPDFLMGKTVTVKKYSNRLVMMCDGAKVATRPRLLQGKGGCSNFMMYARNNGILHNELTASACRLRSRGEGGHHITADHLKVDIEGSHKTLIKRANFP